MKTSKEISGRQAYIRSEDVVARADKILDNRYHSMEKSLCDFKKRMEQLSGVQNKRLRIYIQKYLESSINKAFTLLRNDAFYHLHHVRTGVWRLESLRSAVERFEDEKFIDNACYVLVEKKVLLGIKDFLAALLADGQSVPDMESLLGYVDAMLGDGSIFSSFSPFKRHFSQVESRFFNVLDVLSEEWDLADEVERLLTLKWNGVDVRKFDKKTLEHFVERSYFLKSEYPEQDNFENLPNFFEHLLIQKDLNTQSETITKADLDLSAFSADELVAEYQSMKKLLDEMYQAGGLDYEIKRLNTQLNLVEDALAKAKISLFKDLIKLENTLSVTLKHLDYYGCMVGASDESIKCAGHEHPFFFRLRILSEKEALKVVSPDALKVVNGCLDLMALFKTSKFDLNTLKMGDEISFQEVRSSMEQLNVDLKASVAQIEQDYSKPLLSDLDPVFAEIKNLLSTTSEDDARRGQIQSLKDLQDALMFLRKESQSPGCYLNATKREEIGKQTEKVRKDLDQIKCMLFRLDDREKMIHAFSGAILKLNEAGEAFETGISDYELLSELSIGLDVEDLMASSRILSEQVFKEVELSKSLQLNFEDLKTCQEPMLSSTLSSGKEQLQKLQYLKNEIHKAEENFKGVIENSSGNVFEKATQSLAEKIHVTVDAFKESNSNEIILPVLKPLNTLSEQIQIKTQTIKNQTPFNQYAIWRDFERQYRIITSDAFKMAGTYLDSLKEAHAAIIQASFEKGFDDELISFQRNLKLSIDALSERLKEGVDFTLQSVDVSNPFDEARLPLDEILTFQLEALASQKNLEREYQSKSKALSSEFYSQGPAELLNELDSLPYAHIELSDQRSILIRKIGALRTRLQELPSDGQEVTLNHLLVLNAAKIELLDIHRWTQSAKEDVIRQETSEAITSTPAFQELQLKLESLEEEKKSISGSWFRWFYRGRYRLTEEKIKVVKAFVEGVSYWNISAIHKAINRLKETSIIDKKRGWGFTGKTTTRERVDNLASVVEGLLEAPRSNISALQSEQDALRQEHASSKQEMLEVLSDKTGFLLKKLSAIQGKNEIVREKRDLIHRLAVFKKSLKRSFKDSKLSLYKCIDQYNDLRFAFRALDEKVSSVQQHNHLLLLNTAKVNAQSSISVSEENKEENEGANHEDVGIQNWLNQKGSDVGRNCSRTISSISETFSDVKNGVINSTVGVLSSAVDVTSSFFKTPHPSKNSSTFLVESLPARDGGYFEGKLEDLKLYTEEKERILEAHETLTHKIYQMLLSKRCDRKPGFLRKAKTVTKEFYEHQVDLCHDNEMDALENSFEAVKSFIQNMVSIASDSPDVMWRLIDESLLARIADLKKQGERGAMTPENLFDKSFYHWFFFKVELNGVSLKEQMESCKVSSNDPENCYEGKIKWFRVRCPRPSSASAGFNYFNKTLADHFILQNLNFSESEACNNDVFSFKF